MDIQLDCHEYSFDNVADFWVFGSNINSPNYYEILIKPIVQDYHGMKTVTVQKGEHEITASGYVFDTNVEITYRKDYVRYKIKGVTMHRDPYIPIRTVWEQVKYDDTHGAFICKNIPCKLVEKFPPKGQKVDIIINLNIPNVTEFLWSMWNDECPEYNDDIMDMCPYIIALYIGCLDNPYDFYGNKEVYGNTYRQWNDSGNEIRINNFHPFVDQRNLIYACVKWWQTLPKRIFAKVVEEIQCCPNIGIKYFNGLNEFNSLSELKILMPNNRNPIEPELDPPIFVL